MLPSLFWVNTLYSLRGRGVVQAQGEAELIFPWKLPAAISKNCLLASQWTRYGISTESVWAFSERTQLVTHILKQCCDYPAREHGGDIHSARWCDVYPYRCSSIALFCSIQSIRRRQVPALSQTLSYVLCEERTFSVSLWRGKRWWV